MAPNSTRVAKGAGLGLLSASEELHRGENCGRTAGVLQGCAQHEAGAQDESHFLVPAAVASVSASGLGQKTFRWNILDQHSSHCSREFFHSGGQAI